MAVRSDFVPEDTELDDDWKPRRKAGSMGGGRFSPPSANRIAEALSSLAGMLSAVIFVLIRVGLMLLILYVACKSLWKHGGFGDFCSWLCVAAFAFSRVKEQMLRRFERDRRHVERN